jgi:hypothetical protein
MNNPSIIASGGLPEGESKGRQARIGIVARYAILVAAVGLALAAILFDHEALRVVCGIGATLLLAILVATISPASTRGRSKDVDPGKLYTKRES